MKPSRQQLRILHLIAQGGLTVHSWPHARIEVRVKEGVDQSWRFHLSTAQVLMERGWVEMRGLDLKRSEYTITAEGRELVKELCFNKRVLEDSTETLEGKMLCGDCGRLVPCASKKASPHPADRWHWYYGAICEFHMHVLKTKTA